MTTLDKVENNVNYSNTFYIYKNSTQDENLIFSVYCNDYCVIVEEDILPEGNNYLTKMGNCPYTFFDISSDIIITFDAACSAPTVTVWNP